MQGGTVPSASTQYTFTASNRGTLLPADGGTFSVSTYISVTSTSRTTTYSVDDSVYNVTITEDLVTTQTINYDSSVSTNNNVSYSPTSFSVSSNSSTSNTTRQVTLTQSGSGYQRTVSLTQDGQSILTYTSLDVVNTERYTNGSNLISYALLYDETSLSSQSDFDWLMSIYTTYGAKPNDTTINGQNAFRLDYYVNPEARQIGSFSDIGFNTGQTDNEIWNILANGSNYNAFRVMTIDTAGAYNAIPLYVFGYEDSTYYRFNT